MIGHTLPVPLIAYIEVRFQTEVKLVPYIWGKEMFNAKFILNQMFL